MFNKPWIHVLIYHVVWVATLVGWVHNQVWLGPFFALGYMLWVYSIRKKITDFKWIILAGAIGWAIETFHQFIGVISYSTTVLAPWWLIPLWGSFSLCCGIGLVWLQKPLVASLLGAVGGPLTYMAASGAMNQSFGAIKVGVLAIEWAVLFPMFCLIFQKIYSKNDLYKA